MFIISFNPWEIFCCCQGYARVIFLITTRSSVMTDIGEVLLIIVFIIIAFGGGLYIRTFLTRKAILRVIEIFYEHNALGTNGAKTVQELGLEGSDFLQRMTRPRDYKQNALQILIKEGIITVNENGKLYMVEEKLDQDLRRKR